MKEKKHIQKKNVLVLGDVMLDCYYYGKVERISPEAPIPVFLKGDTKYVLGGGANVVSNLVAANQDVYLCSVIGDDEAGLHLVSMLNEIGCDCSGILHSKGRKTTIKTRLLAQNNQQLIRIDQEQAENISRFEEEELLKIIKLRLSQADIIIISDYLKGVLTISLIQEVIQLCDKKQIPVFIDIKDKNFDKYYGATLLKPNRNELTMITGMPTESNEEILDAAKKLKEKCKCKYVLTTLGSKGMLIIGDSIEEWISSIEQEVYDVSGAGDTVISYFAASFINGYDISESANMANIAAGIKVRKMGTAAVMLKEVMNAYTSKIKDKNNNKLVTINELKLILENQKGKKLVFTNGCFDILHRGHVSYLKAAAEFGDLLIVGLNSDRSVKRLKGQDRPVNTEEDRAIILGALEYVDFVVIFDEDTPLKMIKEVQPDVLVKGADYVKDDVIGASFVESYGGEVKLVRYLSEFSTTGILNKIRRD